MTQCFRDVDPFLVVIPTRDVTDRDDREFRFVHEFSGVRPDVTESLNRYRGVFRQSSQSLQQFEGKDSATAPGGFLTSFCTVVLNGLTRDARWIEAVILFPLVPDPSHRIRIRPHVRCGNVFVRANDFVNLVNELAADSLHFFLGQIARVDADPAFGSAVRNVDDGCLPGHQRRQCTDFIEIDIPVVTQAAFHGSASIVVLHSVAQQCFNPAVVHFNGDFYRHFPLGGLQQSSHTWIEFQFVGSTIEI